MWHSSASDNRNLTETSDFILSKWCGADLIQPEGIAHWSLNCFCVMTKFWYSYCDIVFLFIKDNCLIQNKRHESILIGKFCFIICFYVLMWHLTIEAMIKTQHCCHLAAKFWTWMKIMTRSVYSKRWFKFNLFPWKFISLKSYSNKFILNTCFMFY